jgi:hypothetical protein
MADGRVVDGRGGRTTRAAQSPDIPVILPRYAFQ